jgi:hypothetical protein
MADHHRADLVVDALKMAAGRGRLKPGCIAHSDRGSEYTSSHFHHHIRELGLRQSCGRTRSCFDDAAAESFWALLKEEIGTRVWPDQATARAEVFDFIETFYNRRRLRKHKTFGYLTPAETRKRHQHDLAANQRVSKITGKLHRRQVPDAGHHPVQRRPHHRRDPKPPSRPRLHLAEGRGRRGRRGRRAPPLDDEAGDDNLVLGSKFVVFSTRHRGYLRRGFLRYAHVPRGQPGGEAAIALALARAILDEAEGCMGVLYDGAFRGMHRDVIARRGKLLINKQHKGAETRYIRTLDCTRCRHELWSNNGRIHERVFLDTGTSTLLPVPIRKLERRSSAHTHRWYHLLSVPCARGPHEHREPVGVTTTAGERERGHSDVEKGFHRAEHLLQIPEATAVHQNIYGGREDTESGFSQFDRSLWNSRMIVFGAEAQSLVVLYFLLAQNATGAARYQEDPTNADADAEAADSLSDNDPSDTPLAS